MVSKLEQIHAFMSVVEENGFSNAAKKHRISPGAMTRQIQQLESSLRVELLKRSTRKVQLTELGEQYYQVCKKMMGDFLEAESLISGANKEPSGFIKIVSNRYFGIRHLIPALSEFMTKYPKLKIECELAERFPDFSQEKIDILFGVSIDGPDDLVRKRVGMTRYVLCASAQYLKKRGEPKTPSDLVHHDYITHTIRSPSDIVHFKNNQEIKVKPTLYLNDTFAMRECAIKGMGIVRLHDYILKEALESGQLVEILKNFKTPPQPVYLYYQKQRYLHSKIRCFIDFFSSTIDS